MKLVTTAIIRDGENILVVRRGPGEKLAGFWEFPLEPMVKPPAGTTTISGHSAQSLMMAPAANRCGAGSGSSDR